MKTCTINEKYSKTGIKRSSPFECIFIEKIQTGWCITQRQDLQYNMQWPPRCWSAAATNVLWLAESCCHVPRNVCTEIHKFWELISVWQWLKPQIVLPYMMALNLTCRKGQKNMWNEKGRNQQKLTSTEFQKFMFFHISSTTTWEDDFDLGGNVVLVLKFYMCCE